MKDQSYMGGWYQRLCVELFPPLRSGMTGAEASGIGGGAVYGRGSRRWRGQGQGDRRSHLLPVDHRAVAAAPKLRQGVDAQLHSGRGRDVGGGGDGDRGGGWWLRDAGGRARAHHRRIPLARWAQLALRGRCNTAVSQTNRRGRSFPGRGRGRGQGRRRGKACRLHATS